MTKKALLPRIELDSIKEVEPHQHWDRNDRSPTHPPSVLALANAASQRSVRKPGTPHTHRRSQTIVVAGDLEMDHLQKNKAVEELHTELESKCKALEESQEEAQLAARIGQTLLQRNQEMGAEIESKAIELQNRAESAEQIVQVLERKLSHAVTQIRSLDVARTRATLEAEQLSHELEDASTQIQRLKGENARAKDETERMALQKLQLEEQLEVAQKLIAKMEASQRHVHAEIASKKERIEVLESVERYNAEHISRLEIENQSICQQQHVLETREMHLLVEHDALVAKVATMSHSLKEQQTKNHELVHAIQSLHGEMEDVRDALRCEQTRVIQLTQLNQELEARLDHQHHSREHSSSDDESPSSRLRNGSLFYELSRQIREEVHEAKAQRAKSLATKRELSPEDATAGELESPARSSTRTSRNTSSNNTDSVGEFDDAVVDALAEKETKVGRAGRLPPLQLEPHGSQREDPGTDAVQHDRNEHAEADDDSLLKEFFVLTAAAVKIAGGGLCNDACNIRNEDLYAEAMAQNVTFDQFHLWLERRLEADLEISLSPPETIKAIASVRPPSPIAATPARRLSITSLWSRT